MGQKRVGQKGGGGTTNPEKEPDDSESVSGEMQAELGGEDELGSVPIEDTETETESLADMGVSESFEEKIDEVVVETDVDKSDAAVIKEELGRLSTRRRAGFTEAQLDRFIVTDSDREEYDEDVVTDVVAETFGRSADSTVKQGTDQEIQLDKDQSVSQMEGKVTSLHALTLASGLDTEDHLTGEKRRRQYETEGAAEAAPSTSEERAAGQLEEDNEVMSTQWMNEAAERSNELYQHYAQNGEVDDDSYEVEYEFDGARDDSTRAVVSGREAFVLMGSSLTKEDSTLGTNSFVHHGEKLKSTVDAIGDDAVSDESKEVINYLHDQAQEKSDFDSPWDSNPFDADYDTDEVRGRMYSNLSAGSAVDPRLV